jgi:precorrin-2 dehydrogenase / sirohydrochlorin ferrochelatase
MNLFPVFLKLAGRPVVVVGAGNVGEPKIESLLAADADVLVVAPEATEKVTLWSRDGKLHWQARRYQTADLDNKFLVVAATSSRELNHRIFQEAQERNILCNVVDDPAYCDFYYPAVVNRGDLQIAISTNGRSPALAQRIRKELEQTYDPEYVDWLEELGQWREELFQSEIAPTERKALLHQLASREAFGARRKQSSGRRSVL